MIEQPITPPAPLTELVTDTDHVHLSRLVTESAWRVDLGRADTLHELFVDDGELDVGRIYRGREQIRGWGRGIEDAKSYPGIRHVTSNMRFVAGTDADGRDRFVRTPDGCRFTHRSWVQLFARD